MTLCRLLRSVRRYSSASNPFPFHSPYPPSATQTTDYPSQNPQYNPNHHPVNPPNPYTSNPNQFYSPASSSNPAADSSHYHYNPPSPAAADSSNYHYNPQTPAAASPESSNYYQNPQLSASNGSNYQYNNQTPSAMNTSYSQQSPQIPSPGTSNYYQNPNFPTSTTTPSRSSGFSSAEEAAAERRRRKRRLRIEPPLYALRPNPPPPSHNTPRDPTKPQLPDNTTALTGLRLHLHNRVQSLIRAGDLDNASYIARHAVFQSVRPTVFTCNGLMAGMNRAKRFNDAKALFQYFFRQFNIIPNVVSYNTVILAHCETKDVDEALKVYEYLLQNGPFSPSSVTYQNLTKGLVDAGRIDEAASLLRDMLNKGHGADSSVFNNVILGFLNLGNLEKADELFNELKERCSVYDGKVNATFMDWFFKQGKPKEAIDSYRDLMSRNYRMVPATQNVLLETLLKHGKKKEAWDLFHAMLDDHTPPTFMAVNSETVNLMVNECFKEGDIKEAMDVFTRSGKAAKSRPFQMDVPGYNNMIERLCELEMMDDAENYYTMLCNRQLASCVNTYRILIDTYIKLDRVDDVLSKYSLMVGGKEKLRVIPSRANKWFGYLIEKGRALDCLPILSKMAEREPMPDVTTYEIVIRGLVGEGDFAAVANLLAEMKGHGVEASGSLREFLMGVFEGLGRRAEIEGILNMSTSHYSPQKAYPGPRAPQRVEQGNSGMPWQTGSPDRVPNGNQFMEQTRQPEMMGQVAQRYPSSEQDIELPRMAADNSA
ncbi:hypothetical protein CASFOL_004517 [Castilleja foliolosa]|uniref:Pentatricopeptide repeat-containing protein n=1 Tax=Castilleja foliolosa TaxID=1961234 RepID=A0ABD3EAQ2_9LAMI